MKLPYSVAALIAALGAFSASAQTIFDQNFDGGYTGASGLGSYYGGSPTDLSTTQLTSGGDPNGCVRITMTTTTSGDYYAGQVQLDTVSGNTDPNPSDYVLSFDANGSQAANIQVSIQTWPDDYFGGTQQMNAGVNDLLAAANTWQMFSVNLGTVTTAVATGATWQINFQMVASQWGGAGKTDTLYIDNVILTHLGTALNLVSSANPSTIGDGVTFTATVVTNGLTASNATGSVVFSDSSGPLSTNAVANGVAASAPISNLILGTTTITALYSGNYPTASNTYDQAVNPVLGGPAPANVPIYTDNLVNGFQSGSWATVNLSSTGGGGVSPHSLPYCAAVTDGGNQALAYQRSDVNTTPYSALSFWINGGVGGQHVQVVGLLNYAAALSTPLAPLPTNTWQQVTIPLATLGVANQPNFSGFWIQGTTGSAQPTFYVDDVQLVTAPLPAAVSLNIDASQVIQTVDARQFGVNTATWDGSLGSAQNLPLLQQSGCMALRWPGGSTSDDYDWASDPSGNALFQNLATNLGAQVFTTVNYGSGTASEAAAWVLSANKTNNCGFKYWEVGNECYGSWENDTHAIEHDPYTYATNAVAYIKAMRAAYPTVPIHVGVVVVPGENTYVNNTNHFAINPRTLATNYGWTPIVLSQMNDLGVRPDFLIYHYYAQYTDAGWTYYSQSPDSDPILLQTAGNPDPVNYNDWASAAASLRQMITDYLGAAAGSNIELCVTENNSDAGEMGRQSTSLVNALYFADSTSQLMRTEFRSYVWWDLHNGYTTDGDLDPSIYGWRNNGDYGILNASDVPYPTYYAQKLLQYFARPGDAVLNSTSSNLLLSAYSVLRTNGALTLLVINKDMTTNITGQIALTNYSPWSTATIQSYGIPQDQAAEFNDSQADQDIATSTYTGVSGNFSYTFPPLSLTLFTFYPAAASLAVESVQPTQVQLQLRGQSGGPYVIQSSADLVNWTPVSTNSVVGGVTNINLTVAQDTPAQFYRAVWVP